MQKNSNTILIIPLIGGALFGLSYLLSDTAKTVCFYLGIALMALGIIAYIYSSTHKAEEKDGNKYKAKNCIMSAPELNLYNYLLALLQPKYRVLPQIALVSIVDKLNNTSYRNELFRIVDFVVFDKDFKPLLAIELNDASHKRADRIARDEKVKSILDRAGIKLLFVEKSLLSDEKTLRKEILKNL